MMPDRRPAHSWVFPHALVAATFVLVWLQSDHSRIHDLPTPSGCTPGVLSRASIGGQPIAEPVHSHCHGITEAPRVVSMAEEPILQHLRIDATWDGAARDALLAAVNWHRLKTIRCSNMSIKVLL